MADAPPYGCLSVLALPFLLGGAAMTFVALDSLVLIARSASWPTVPATLEHVELEKRGSNSKELVATYAYEWEGVKYRSDRPAPETGGSSDPVHAERAALLTKAMEAKTSLPARVNPDDPNEALLFREVRGYTLGLLGAALLFFLVGLGGFVTLQRLGANVRWRRRRAALYPGEPWRLERCWGDRSIRSATSLALIGIWSVTAFVGLLSVPFVGVFGLDEDAPPAGRLAAGVLVGSSVVLLLLAVRATARYLRHGSTALEFAAFPLRPGLSHPGGVIWRYETPPQPVRCRLRCLVSRARTRSSSRAPDVDTEALHDEAFEVPAEQWQRQGAGWWMPVTVRLPDEAPARSDTVRWWLEVSLAGGGVRASHVFDLPVFEVVNARPAARGP